MSVQKTQENKTFLSIQKKMEEILPDFSHFFINHDLIYISTAAALFSLRTFRRMRTSNAGDSSFFLTPDIYTRCCNSQRNDQHCNKINNHMDLLFFQYFMLSLPLKHILLQISFPVF